MTDAWRMRTREADPWLSAREIEQINFPHTDNGKRRVAGSRDFFALLPVLDAGHAVMWREPVLRRRHEAPTESFDIDRGGWLPLGAAAHSTTARDIAHRQAFRARGDHAMADTIRRVIDAGGTELRDYPDGTMWLYGKGTAWV